MMPLLYFIIQYYHSADFFATLTNFIIYVKYEVIKAVKKVKDSLKQILFQCKEQKEVNDMKYKFTAAVTALILIISVLFISCSADKDNKSMDLSDIDTMNIGAEMPDILYADDDSLVLHGTFGIIRFDLTEEKIIRRINYDEFSEVMDYMHFYNFSDDGKRLFVTLPQDEKYFEYNLKTGKLKSIDKIEDELFSPSLLSMEQQIEIAQNSGSKNLIGITYFEKENSVILLRAESNWQMKTLQIVEYDLKSNKEIKVIDVFQ